MAFNEQDIQNGLYLVCSNEGRIMDVLFDDLELIDTEKLPAEFSDIIDRESISKAAAFWIAIRRDEFVFDYELYVKREGEPILLKFSAACMNGQVWVIAATQDAVLEKMLDELMLINNEQQNKIRSTEKELSKVKKRPASGSLDAYDEISKVNNELINAQRKLIKQNREIMRLNSDLKSSNEELEHFAYAVSHDLKEPLRMIKSFMELLDRKYSGEVDDKGREYINYAVDGAERMSQMIGNLLEYSRIGRMYTEFKEVDLNEVVSQAEALHESRLKNLGGAIVYTQLPVIMAQGVPMQQLFNNLISNSIKYRKEDTAPRIEISYEEQQNHWLFSVNDNGRGIDAEYHSRIFDVFRRIDHDPENKGTGMGLAICKKIVEHHGGEIWVESAVGEGSTFKFTIAKQ